MQPSDYELEAWLDIQNFKGSGLSQVLRNASEQAANGAAKLAGHATTFLEDHPGTQSVVARGQAVAAKGTKVIGIGSRKMAGVIPDGMTDWSGAAFGSAKGMVGQVSRTGLSPKKVVAKHQKKGHDVVSLSDLRRLDLKQIDAVRGRGAGWGYPFAAAVSGGVAGALMTGGTTAIVASAGAAAAPSGGVIASAFIGDAAAVYGLASRCVGQVSLLYGYDPEDPAEKLFVMSVVNAGSAMSVTAKTAAMRDISNLTQALFRGKGWVVLDKSVVAQVSKKFMAAFTRRLTKQGLGKVVPYAGVAIGGAFNWAALDSVEDAAKIAYRRRFLLEKYPHLADDEAPVSFIDLIPGEVVKEDADEAISVLDEIAEAGGPDLKV